MAAVTVVTVAMCASLPMIESKLSHRFALCTYGSKITLDIKVFGILRVFLDEDAAGFDFLAHQGSEGEVELA